MHPTFGNSLTLIDSNFGTKTPLDLKEKKNYKTEMLHFSIML